SPSERTAALAPTTRPIDSTAVSAKPLSLRRPRTANRISRPRFPSMSELDGQRAEEVARESGTSAGAGLNAGGGDLEVGHWSAEEQPAAGESYPSRPPRRSLHARAVGGDSRVRVHLAIQLRDQHEGDAGAGRFDDSRTRPDMLPAVKAIPGSLRADPNLLQRHRRVGRKELGPALFRNEPVLSDR